MAWSLQNMFLTGLLLAILIAIWWIDARKLIIPDGINLALLGFGFAQPLVKGSHEFLMPLLGALAGGLSFWFIKLTYKSLRGIDGLGFGDVKFMFGAGSIVGPVLIPWLVLIAAVSGIGFVLIQSLRGKSLTAQDRLPFGPHLSIGLFACWLLQISGVG